MNIISIKDLLKNYYKEFEKDKSYFISKYEFLYNKLRKDQGYIITIAGRPGHGKTVLRQAILWDIINRNQDCIFNIVDFQLDVPLAYLIEKDMAREGYNSNNKEHLVEFGKRIIERGNNIHFIDSINNVEEIYTASRYIFDNNTGANVYNIMTLDFAGLLPHSKTEGGIAEFLNICKKLRREHNCICIILTQLNRNVNDNSRIKPSSALNRILDTDIYGSDLFMQYSDLLLTIDIPIKRGISIWSEKSIMCDNNTVIITLLKDRISGNLSTYVYEKNNFDYIFKFNVDESININNNNVQEDIYDEEIIDEEEYDS
ncbi:MAG: hypothetical protein KatS3mg002_1327 [Candidatus Woesearchaeota archaeon]|nr:MAG: hypothetical protein KatS3mg002_1327 [Candidatus Woesearchaeota archaeon]